MKAGEPIWKAMGAKRRTIDSPRQLWAAATAYFGWAEANPLYEEKPFAYQGEVKIERVARMRAMSITGLLVFLGIGKEAWTDYQSRAGFAEVTARIEDVIRTQKFEGAAADLLNASIVQRELGLGDKAELSLSGETISDEDLDARIAELVAKAGTGAADRGKGEAKGKKPARHLSAVSKTGGLPRRRR
jgi:hypothetical protein